MTAAWIIKTIDIQENRTFCLTTCVPFVAPDQLSEVVRRSLKQEAVYLHEITNGFQAKRIIDGWIGFYNSERPHTALDKRTPDRAYFIQTEKRKAA